MVCNAPGCALDASPNRKRCEGHLAQKRLAGKLWRIRHAEAGLCERCTRPSTDGRLCDAHIAYDLAHRPQTDRPVGRQRLPRGDAWARLFEAGQRPGQIARDAGVHVAHVTAALIARGLYQSKRRAA
jgi:hypothetical protein